MPSAPWTLRYADGSGNVATLTDQGDGATCTYKPQVPRRSSSGTYSGGEPRHGPLTSAQVEQIWTLLAQLEAGPRAQERSLGTASFHITTPEGERSFLVPMGQFGAFSDYLEQVYRGL